jgi:hypothetical protein
MAFARDEIEAMNEKELRKKVLVPLLNAMGFQGVYIQHGGSLELGKDIVCWQNDQFSGRLNYAVVAKAESIKGAVTGASSATEVLNQVEQCFNEPYVDHQTGQERKVERCFVITSKQIISTALHSIKGKLAKGNLDKLVIWINGDELWKLVDQHLNPGPAKKRIFKPVPLTQISELSDLEHSELPGGWILLGEVPFEIASVHEGIQLVALTQPTLANEPASLVITQKVEEVLQVHLLITASYALKLIMGYGLGEGWDGRVCGRIVIDYEDGTTQVQDLKLGYHLRDWNFGNKPWAVDALRSEQARQVWHSSDNQCTLDLLSVPVKHGPKTVTSVRLVAQMEEGLLPAALWEKGQVIAESYPRIRLHAITFEVDISK